MDVACPQCGNPNLDVDAANSVVFCKKCGFAVRVDPQTGDVTPLAPGGGQGAGAPMAPEVYAKTILGMDPLTFLLGGTALLLALNIFNFFGFQWFVVFEAVLVIFWWYKR
jgi:ribosomal protein S27E